MVKSIPNSAVYVRVVLIYKVNFKIYNFNERRPEYGVKPRKNKSCGVSNQSDMFKNCRKAHLSQHYIDIRALQSPCWSQ